MGSICQALLCRRCCTCGHCLGSGTFNMGLSWFNMHRSSPAKNADYVLQYMFKPSCLEVHSPCGDLSMFCWAPPLLLYGVATGRLPEPDP